MQGMWFLTFAIVYVALDAILRGLPTRAKHVSVWNTYTEIVTNHQDLLPTLFFTAVPLVASYYVANAITC